MNEPLTPTERAAREPQFTIYLCGDSRATYGSQLTDGKRIVGPESPPPPSPTPTERQTGEFDFESFDFENDPEVDDLNAARGVNDNGYWGRHMNGDVMWHEAPYRERCGGSGSIECMCAGDFCCCGNMGEIECLGCEDCEGDDDYDEPWDDDDA